MYHSFATLMVLHSSGLQNGVSGRYGWPSMSYHLTNGTYLKMFACHLSMHEKLHVILCWLIVWTKPLNDNHYVCTKYRWIHDTDLQKETSSWLVCGTLMKSQLWLHTFSQYWSRWIKFSLKVVIVKQRSCSYKNVQWPCLWPSWTWIIDIAKISIINAWYTYLWTNI